MAARSREWPSFARRSCRSAGCAFYWQAIGGEFDLLRKRTPIDKLLVDPKVDPKTKTELTAVAQIRKFAVTELLLPDNKSYTTYVALDRPYVVWNVVAAPEFSVQPKRWCFPVAGCVSYRGFFDRADAERFEKKLVSEGYDTSSGGSSAYSTLGYFADPVLSTMLGGGELYVASTLFHELAHQKLYVKNDSEFSEAFATAIEEYGTERWLAARGNATALAAYQRRLVHRADFAALISAQQDRLRAVFATNEPDGGEACGQGPRVRRDAGGLCGLEAALGRQQRIRRVVSASRSTMRRSRRSRPTGAGCPRCARGSMRSGSRSSTPIRRSSRSSTRPSEPSALEGVEDRGAQRIKMS